MYHLPTYDVLKTKCHMLYLYNATGSPKHGQHPFLMTYIRLTSAQFHTHVHTHTVSVWGGDQEWNNVVGVCCWAVTITNDEKTVLSQA